MPTGQPHTPNRLAEYSGGESPDAARLEEQIVESYLARIEQTMADRLDQQVEDRLGRIEPHRFPVRGFTARLAASLAVGIPLSAVAGGVSGAHGHGEASVVAIVAVLALIFGLNVYYTEAEKDLEKERLRRRP